MAEPQELSWPDVIAHEAKAAKIPPALALAVAEQESGFNPNARGNLDEIGLFQLRPGTAKDLGVDPTNPLQNIRGGLKYLSQQLQANGGDVSKALGAYNAGPGGKANPEYVNGVLGRLEKFSEKPQPSSALASSPSSGDTVVGLDTNPLAKWDRRAAERERQQAITTGVLTSMPAAGQAVGAALRGAGALAQMAGKAAGAVPWYAREMMAHLAGGGTPGYVAAAVGPKGLNLAGRGLSVVGQAVPKILGTAPLAAEEAAAPSALAQRLQALTARSAAAPISAGPVEATVFPSGASQPGYNFRGRPNPSLPESPSMAEAPLVPTHGRAMPAAEPMFEPNAARLAPLKGSKPATQMHLVMEEAERQGFPRLNWKESELGTKLIAKGEDPVVVYRTLIEARTGPTAPADPAAALAQQLGTPSDAEVRATFGRQARAGKKSLMAKYGEE